jgi:hypothetical protein
MLIQTWMKKTMILVRYLFESLIFQMDDYILETEEKEVIPVNNQLLLSYQSKQPVEVTLRLLISRTCAPCLHPNNLP